MTGTWDPRLHEGDRERAPERDGRLGNDRAQRDGAVLPAFYRPAKRFTAKRGGRPGGLDRGSLATPQRARSYMSVPQDVKLDTTKSSPLAHGAKQGAMLPAPADPDKPAPFGMGTPTSDDKNGTPKRTPNEHVKDPTSNHKSPPLGQRGPSLGHQDRRGGSMHPWSSDSAAPQAASAAFRPRMQQTPSPKTTMSGPETALPELRERATRATGENSINTKRLGLACRRCLWRMGSPQWTKPFDGCHNQAGRGEELACQVCKERKGVCQQPPATVETFAWALQRAWESRAADGDEALAAAWKRYASELELYEKTQAKERRAAAARAAASFTPAPSKRPANISQQRARTATGSTKAKQPARIAQQPAFTPAPTPVAANQTTGMTSSDTAAMMAIFAEGMRLGLGYGGPRPDDGVGALASQIIKQYVQDKSVTNRKRKRNNEEEEEEEEEDGGI